MVEKVLLAKPRGFCAGVEMAIKALAWMVKIFEPPIYCYHEIVHNKVVVDQFQAKGVIFIEDVSEVPPGAPLMLSAHGTAPQVEQKARASKAVVINSACPLVTKVHHELKTRASRGYKIIYVGHPRHEEAVGTVAEAPEAVTLVMRVSDLDQFNPPAEAPVALLAQTTLSHDEWSAILNAAKQRFPQLWTPTRSDLCFATTNRQSAVKALARLTNTIIVIGSANSSNTLALVRVAQSAGATNVIRVDGPEELPDNLTGIVGLTSGASAPEEIINRVITKLAPEKGVEEVSIGTEDEYFPPPRELRELIKSVGLCASVGFLSNTQFSALAADKEVAAKDALTNLAAS